MKRQGIIPDAFAVNLAYAYDRVDILEWLNTMNMYPTYFMYINDEDEAHTIARLTIAYEKGLRIFGFESARNKHLSVLRWLDEKHLLLEQHTADVAAIDGSLDIVLWLQQKGIFPDIQYVDDIAGAGHLDILMLMAQRSPIRVTQHAANVATSNGKLETLKWLYKTYGFLPNLEGINDSASGGHLNTLSWLEQYKLLPDQNGANKAAGNGHLDTVIWLEQRGILPTECKWEHDMDNIDNINFALFEWLEERGIPISP